jgi:hypothetical protein
MGMMPDLRAFYADANPRSAREAAEQFVDLFEPGTPLRGNELYGNGALWGFDGKATKEAIKWLEQGGRLKRTWVKGPVWEVAGEAAGSGTE